MSEKQIEIAQENANRNFERIKNQLPKKLVKMEESLLGKISKHQGNVLTKLGELYGFMPYLIPKASHYSILVR